MIKLYKFKDMCKYNEDEDWIFMSLYDDRYIGGDNLESIAPKLPYHPQNKQDFEAFEELLEDKYILIGEAEDIDKVREKYPEEFI